jgi:DNA polymerase-3 subunit epsilon
MVQNAPYFKDIAKDILDFIDGNIIVCHNANFDLALLKKEMSFVFQTDIKFKYIDTLRLARKYFNFQSNALGAIAYALGIETKELHRAMADVKIMMSISKYLFLNMYRKGIEFVEPSLF